MYLNFPGHTRQGRCGIEGNSLQGGCQIINKELLRFSQRVDISIIASSIVGQLLEQHIIGCIMPTVTNCAFHMSKKAQFVTVKGIYLSVYFDKISGYLLILKPIKISVQSPTR